MRKKLLMISTMILVCLPSIAGAEEVEKNIGNTLKLGGYLQTDNRMRFKNEGEYSFHEYRLDLKTDAKPGENLYIYSELWLRNIGFSEVNNSSDLSDKDKVSPWNLDIREAYADIYGFILKDMDIRIGRQRIAWGTADKLNPTDNLNSNDLEDIWDFGRHLGSDAIVLKYYAGNFTITGVYIPFFTPAVLPSGNESSALSPGMTPPPGLAIRTISDPYINMPKNNFKEGSIPGIKIGTKIFDFDFSLSYIYSRDDLPLMQIMQKVILSPTGVPGEVDVSSELMYPRMHVAGVDTAGSLFNIGVWAECAVFFPEEVYTITDLSELGLPEQNSVALKKEPYAKYVVGADYNFKSGIYINFQYLHGFIHERGRDNLEDYFMFGLEYKFYDNKFKIIPVQGGVEIKDYNEIKGNYAVIYSPEFYYYPMDNLEICLGVRILDGKETTVFGRLNDNDEVFLRVKGSF